MKGTESIIGDQRRRELRAAAREARKHAPLYVMLLPCVVFFVVFAYVPMAGIVLAFKEYMFNKGIFGSPWVGFRYFENFFTSYDAPRLLANTLMIGFLKIVVEFPFPIVLALMLNEIRCRPFKSIVQSISYLPNFLSWVIIVTMLQRILAPNTGLLNEVLGFFGFSKETFFLMEESSFYPIIFVSDIWKNVGWGSIIYLAAISGIDPGLYEAARIDGANRWHEIRHITLPSITLTMGILFIMSIGSLLSTGFDQVYLLRTPGNMSLADTLDVYVIRVGLSGGQFGYAAAIGLIQGFVGLVLVVSANKAAKKYTGVSIW